MDFFNALFNKKEDVKLKDRIAEALKTDKELLNKFEENYRKNVLDFDKCIINTLDLWEMSSKRL